IISALAVSIFLFAIQFSAKAQSGTIKGSVKDADGNFLPGASVSVQHSKIGTVTDQNGNYLLNVPAGSRTIVVSFIGQATQRAAVIVTNGNTLVRDFSMTNLYEQSNVVVVGSRAKKGRSKLTTAVPVDV